MSDMVRAWLDHADTLDRGAFGGPWTWELDDAERVTMTTHGTVPFTLIERDEFRGATEEAEWIAHARTALPKATAALRAVLDLHQQADYQRHVPRMLRRTPEDHLPYRPCDGCREEWPCPTVKAITAALTSHQHPTPPGSSGKCEHEARGITWAEGNTTAYVCETCEHEWTEEGG